MTVRLPVESGAPALGELLRFGDDIEVIGPAVAQGDRRDDREDGNAVWLNSTVSRSA
jgi:hypothetical protein